MPPSTNRDYSKLYVPAAIVIGFLILGIFIMIGLSKMGTGATGAQQPQVAVDVKDVKTDGDPYIGNKDAPVTLVYWSDYQCPFCKAVEVGGVPQIPIDPSIPTLISDYVNTGKLKIVFKDYPFLGQDSITAAEYEHAIWKLFPSHFYDWREAMFKAQDEEGDQGFGDADSIDALIKTIPGLDLAAIKADLAANKAEYDTEMNADKTEGTSFGVQGTPGFITGKVLIPGAVDLSTFKADIDPQLK
ncbi:MAG TPA: thioredoxin domain-containing protein [Candidatus Paceibacterota bacterium]|nr:thioredoxin domain-containing protein [Candidatus Paceibacterota bacterium]